MNDIREPRSLRDLLTLCRERGARIPDVTEGDIEKAMSTALLTAEKMEQMGVECHLITAPTFPFRLRSIPDPPLCLFTQGNINAIHALSIAVIGTREPSDYGVKVAHRIGQRLAEQTITVVSGLAEGCDTAGHQGCIDGSGKTVAFLAHGHGRIYPAANEALARHILETGGCLATEYPPGTPPMRNAFVQRDRLQSGASAGIIVIETDIKGGTMHTVKFAEAQNRRLAAINHPKRFLDYPKTRGNQLLIQQQRAFPLQAAEDLERFIADCAGGAFQETEKKDQLDLI